MTDPLATIVIPNYNGARFLPALLGSLARQSDRRFVVTIVDDCSPDGGVGDAARDYPFVEVVQNETNLGFAGACNVGLRRARTPFVTLLNNDTTVDSQWFENAMDAFDADDIGSVASLVLLAEPPHLIDSAGDVYSVAGGAAKRAHLAPREAAAGLSDECFSACGASAFFRRSALDAVGLLDEAFESYYEDVDLGFRLAWAGYRCRFAGNSICYHHLSASYSPKGWKYHYNSARNAEIVWQANMPKTLRRKFAGARRAFLAIQSMNKLRQGVWRAYRQGRAAGRRDAARIEAKRAAQQKLASISDEQLAQRLVHDWFSLHVRGSLRANRRRATCD
ncbi:MAG: glycosyltransferase family 2 protein [Phycisphaerales bacterium]|nr:glycosyltransferase family 2 protein [Phycisphaerales bacterium]MCB9857980.1 glycosyltransferase family 2 protein [Phycisphaerales bacterium]MCB9864927.1 glycosyltransferase family 2 protein [Phycisphaerales bacterium]